jgi:hypothetical protein
VKSGREKEYGKLRWVSYYIDFFCSSFPTFFSFVWEVARGINGSEWVLLTFCIGECIEADVKLQEKKIEDHETFLILEEK